MVSPRTSESFPGFDRVYWLRDPQKRGAFVAWLGMEPEDAHGLLRGTVKPHTPIPVRWFMGRAAPGDFVWPSLSGPKIVSARVISALTAENITGWSTYPVTVSNRDGEMVDGFAGLSITGRCGPIEGHRSTPEPKQFPGGVFTVYRGLFFDPQLWDGSDLFLSNDGRLYVFAVQKVRDLFHKMRIKDVAFESLDSIISLERPAG